MTGIPSPHAPNSRGDSSPWVEGWQFPAVDTGGAKGPARMWPPAAGGSWAVRGRALSPSPVIGLQLCEARLLNRVTCSARTRHSGPFARCAPCTRGRGRACEEQGALTAEEIAWAALRSSLGDPQEGAEQVGVAGGSPRGLRGGCWSCFGVQPQEVDAILRQCGLLRDGRRVPIKKQLLVLCPRSRARRVLISRVTALS